MDKYPSSNIVDTGDEDNMGEEENEKQEKGQAAADTTVCSTSIKSTPHFGLCKHILAAFIAEAVGRYSSRILTAEDMKHIFM